MLLNFSKNFYQELCLEYKFLLIEFFLNPTVNKINTKMYKFLNNNF